MPPPPTKPTSTSTSKAKSSAPLDLTVKSTKPPLSFAVKGIQPSDTVAHIKAQLAAQHPRAPPPSDQRLLIKGKVLADTKLLQEYIHSSSASTPLTITLMAKPGSTWTGAEPQPLATSPVVATEPESFAQPTPSHASSTSNLAPKKSHGRSLSGDASNMPVPSLTLSPTPSGNGNSTGVDLTLAVDLELQPDNPRSLTPKAEAYAQVMTDPEFWSKLLEFLKGYVIDEFALQDPSLINPTVNSRATKTRTPLGRSFSWLQNPI